MTQKSIVAAFLISVILLSSPILSSFGTNAFAAAATTGTFGNAQVGQYATWMVPGYKDSCRYQAPESGAINSISMYIQAGNAQVRFGVYSDVNGKPSQLLAQSNQVSTAANQWVTASLTVSIVAGQYYWLTVTSNAKIDYCYDYAAGASLVYAAEPTTTMSTDFGVSTVWAAAKSSMYATYTTTTAAPIATPSPTPVPTATPSPTPVPTATPTPTPAPIVPSMLITQTFGNAQVGQYATWMVPGYKDSCRYQAPESGAINSISMYIQAGNAQVRFGVYSDVNGKPSQLLAQSNQVSTAANQWVTASLTVSIVAGQYYWLTVTSNAKIDYCYDYAAGASLVYAAEPTTTMSTDFGVSTVWAAAKSSMYATYTTTTAAPIATPSPTPVPTATPSPTPVPTATPSPTPVPTATPSPTPVPTATPSPTPVPTSENLASGSLTGLGGDYRLTYADTSPELWLQWGYTYQGTYRSWVGWASAFQGYHTTRLGFNFIEVPGANGPSLMDYNVFNRVLEIFDSAGNKIIAVMQDYDLPYPTNYMFSQGFWDSWINFATHYKGDNRIAAISLYGELGPDDYPGYTRLQATQRFADLTRAIHQVDPDRVVIFPTGQTYYGSAIDWISDVRASGIVNEPNVVFDIVHPYFFESSYDLEMTPEQKADWYVYGWIAPCVNAFGSSRCYAGETFVWNAGDLQYRWMVSIINKYSEYDVEFTLWATLGTPPMDTTIAAMQTSNYKP